MYKVILLYVMLVNISLAQEILTDHNQCTSCHLPGGESALLQPLPFLCITCHVERVAKGEHIINVEPRSRPFPELPLLNGVIICSTCHDPHASTPGQLRLEKDQICQACHRL